MARTIAVDLDGTLAEYDRWRGIGQIGDPIKSVVNALRKEKSRGTRIIIHTARMASNVPGVKRIIEKWLKENDIPYDEIWDKPGKPMAEEYWDDRAVKKP